ncbi:MAG: biosynthetic-type acetolactate synthase large subunit [Anaerovibrio sp.]|uniref:biosynthetic-type acetolactate synthase large subunit n=1 Tax=Anaerovibrio sp. TaxID=1872532 RepID=UPI0025F8E793|nr:biosynthetic-type acetolactate synthase large subunit [Anaerovibrio sp.]MCR5175943.1 biosynthetic-type acetolactate synthase large subunit [Anaerovibrio sp.]
MNGAQIIVKILEEQGIDTLFGYPGGMILPLYDALYDAKDIKQILVTHEQNAAHAADGYARATGKVGVCIATSGPGATNLVTGIATAFMDSIPVVAITGQVDTGLLGRDSFQETDILDVTMPITKHNYKVKNPAKLAETLRDAFKIAKKGRPGPVLVDIPRDILLNEAPYHKPDEVSAKNAEPDADFKICAAEAAEVICQAERPVIIVGGGVVSANASKEVIAFAEHFDLPIVYTLMGIGGVPRSHKNVLGFAGMHGKKAANNAIANADLVISLGSRFADRQTGNLSKYTVETKFIHIDIDPAEIDKNIASSIGLAGNMKKILAMLMSRSPLHKLDKWWETIRSWKSEYAYDYAVNRLTLPWALNHIARATAGKEFAFATDVGQHQMWCALHLRVEEPRTWFTSGGLGTMGFGLPAAMGAQVAYVNSGSKRRVIHVAGDGGIKMTGNEYYTIARLNLPIISIIVNNRSLGMIRQLQNVYYNERYIACELDYDMDYAGYAKSFGINTFNVSTSDEFADAFAKAVAEEDKPHVIVVNLHRSFVEPMIKGGAKINEFVDFK